MAVGLKIHVVGTGDDYLSHGLIRLTKIICKRNRLDGGSGLAGKYGYGVNFENEVFMMHRYCWCELPDCPWCADYCTCGDDWEKNPCAACRGERKAAPNFLHKPTGATVHWYKWIGRGMEVSVADWAAILKASTASLEGSLQ